MNWTAIWVTFKLASLTATALLLIGLPIAYWVSFSRWRWKFIVESVVALPLVLPPTVLGFYILVAIGPHSPLGRFYSDIVGHPLPFTFEGLLLASILYSLPFAVQPFAAAFEQVDRKLIEASWTLGISKIGTFFKLILPLSKAGILTGVVLSFAHTLGEFGVVLMVGGSIPGETRTIAIAIYDRVQAFDNEGAARMSIVLVLLSMTTIMVALAMSRRVGRQLT
jgi:molybdate transport system permease protein